MLSCKGSTEMTKSKRHLNITFTQGIYLACAAYAAITLLGAASESIGAGRLEVRTWAQAVGMPVDVD